MHLYGPGIGDTLIRTCPDIGSLPTLKDRDLYSEALSPDILIVTGGTGKLPELPEPQFLVSIWNGS